MADRITELKQTKVGFPNPAKLGKKNKLDSQIYSIKESGLESPRENIDDTKGTFNGVNPNIFKHKKHGELSEADKMRMTDNRHDKKNHNLYKYKKHGTMTPLSKNIIIEQSSPQPTVKKKRSYTEHGMAEDSTKLVNFDSSQSDAGKKPLKSNKIATEFQQKSFQKLQVWSKQNQEIFETPQNENLKNISQLEREQKELLQQQMFLPGQPTDTDESSS